MSVVVMGESNDQAGEECVLCMQSALTLTAREGSRSHTRTGHAIVALVTATYLLSVSAEPVRQADHACYASAAAKWLGGAVQQ